MPIDWDRFWVTVDKMLSQTEEERMTTQAELFKRLQQSAGSGEKKELPPFVKFEGQNIPIQGIVKEVYVGKEWDPQLKGPAKDKNGNEKPQINLTLELEDGRVVRQGFAGNLLFKLGQALQEAGLDEVPVGALVGSAWTGMWEPPNGGRKAREHTVKIKVG